MIQKVLQVGTSAAVTIPKKSLAELGLKIGGNVEVHVEKGKRTVTIRPVASLSKQEERITEIGLNFINRYREDLEALRDK